MGRRWLNGRHETSSIEEFHVGIDNRVYHGYLEDGLHHLKNFILPIKKNISKTLGRNGLCWLIFEENFFLNRSYLTHVLTMRGPKSFSCKFFYELNIA